MTAAVLRDASFDLAAVRIGRAAPRPAAAAAVAKPPGFDEALAAARAEGRQAGYAAGERAGYEEGLRRANAQVQEQARAATAASESAAAACALEQQRSLALLAEVVHSVEAVAPAASEDDLLVLCLDVLASVLGAALLQPAALRAQVAALLARCAPGPGLAVHVHPGDLAALQHAGPWPAGLALVPDPQVVLGGCIVRAAAGALDARLETLLDEARRRILQARGP
jgi:flagellar assembly protein FliH